MIISVLILQSVQHALHLDSVNLQPKICAGRLPGFALSLFSGTLERKFLTFSIHFYWVQIKPCKKLNGGRGLNEKEKTVYPRRNGNKKKNNGATKTHKNTFQNMG